MVLWVQFSHTDHWLFNMAPHGKELSADFIIRNVALHKDGLGYKKFGNSLELSYSTVARVIQRFSKMGLTRNRPRKGRSKMLSPCAVRHMQKLAGQQKWKVSLSVLRPYATHWKKSDCMAVIPEGSSSGAGSQKCLQTVYWRQPGQEHEWLEPCPVVWWV